MSNLMKRRVKPKLQGWRCISYEGKDLGDIIISDIDRNKPLILRHENVVMEESTKGFEDSVSKGELHKYLCPVLYADDDPPLTLYKFLYTV